MPSADATDRGGEGAVYETEGATVNVRPREVEGRRAVEYAVVSDHPAPIRVRVRQPIPEDVTLDDLGFPGDCADDWERDGEALVFDREVAPDATVRTAWGVTGDLEADLERPVVDVQPASSDGEAVDLDVDDAATAAFDEVEGSLDDVAAGEGIDEAAAELESVPDLDDLSGDGIDADAPDPADGEAALDDGFEAPDILDEGDGLDEGGARSSAPDAEGTEAEGTGQRAAAEDAAADGAARGDGAGDGKSGAAGTDHDVAAEAATAEAATAGAATADDVPGGEGTADDVAIDPDDPDSVVARLVAELHDEALDDSHRAALADALEVRLSDSTNAFVNHVRERQRRRADRLEEELEAIEESVEGLYGLKADASEVSALKRAITEVDDAKASDGDLRSLRSRVETLAETSADAETVEDLRADHESLADALADTDEALADLEERAAEDRGSIRSAVEALEADFDDLEERAATDERVDSVADDLATLRDAAATETALDELRADLDSVEAQLDERVDLLADRHDELAAESATDEALDSLRTDHEDRIDETNAELDTVRDTLEERYSTDAELQAELDRRVHRSLGKLLAFGIGAVGLAATIPLAIAGSPAAAATFLGGALTIGLWWWRTGSGGLTDSPLEEPEE